MSEISNPPRRVAVIGAGAAGLCAAKHLLSRGIHVTVYELGSKIGGLWAYENDNRLSPAYLSLHLNSENLVTAYKDFPFPEGSPLYPDHFEVHRYLESYADRFGLGPHIRFNAKVDGLEPLEGACRRSARRVRHGCCRHRPPGRAQPSSLARQVLGRVSARARLSGPGAVPREACTGRRDGQQRRRHRGGYLRGDRQDAHLRTVAGTHDATDDVRRPDVTGAGATRKALDALAGPTAHPRVPHAHRPRADGAMGVRDTQDAYAPDKSPEPHLALHVEPHQRQAGDVRRERKRGNLRGRHAGDL